jgi:hypothetical protein
VACPHADTGKRNQAAMKRFAIFFFMVLTFVAAKCDGQSQPPILLRVKCGFADQMPFVSNPGLKV